MAIKALVFDVDGTLADSEEAHRLAFNAAFAEAGVAWVWSPERYAELRKTTGGRQRMAAFVRSLALPPAEVAAWLARVPDLHRRKTALFIDHVRAGHLPLRPGIRRLLLEAREAGLLLAIAATTTRASIEALLESTLGPAASQWFACIATGDDVANSKPAPDVYLRALASLDVRADACVAFEDSGRGLAAARSAGLFTVVTTTRWTRDDNLRGANLVVASLGDADAPLRGDDARRVGGPLVDLAELARRHAHWARDCQQARWRMPPGERSRLPAGHDDGDAGGSTPDAREP